MRVYGPLTIRTSRPSSAGAAAWRAWTTLTPCHIWCRLANTGSLTPEYFAVDEHGELFERRPNEYGMHVCTSNPDVLDLVVRKALETMERDPDAGFVSISQADGQFHCRCPGLPVEV